MVHSGQPLAEVFGHLVTDQTEAAQRYRSHRLCPFNNKVPNCTKDKAKDPLGVCSIYHENEPVITCPVRFRQDWIIADHAASFFFEDGAQWTSLTEVRLNDANGRLAGNIDVVLVAYDGSGKVVDFGALEIQAVYISGNVREPFEYYMDDPQGRAFMDWSRAPNYPRPDYLSSSRKRLVPQLVYKGRILHSWKKKIAVALSRSFFATLPALKRVPREEADIAWLIYDLKLRSEERGGAGRYYLTKVDEVFTEFEPALLSITIPSPGRVEDFIMWLQEKLDDQLEPPPTNQTVEKPF
ncbi:MAG: NotI family restriction endonuclease [Anaerolineae bacterium]|nr:NotI family restriction endonuclease [Anaerolineae bacterium]